MNSEKYTSDEIHTQIQYRLIEKLEASERRYRLMVENLQEIVFTIDKFGEITFLNSAWTKILGYSLEKSLQIPLFDFISVEQSQLGKQTLKTVIDCQTKIRTELSFKHQQGKKVWMELSANPNPDGGASGTLTDISKRKEVTEKLEYAAYHDDLTGLYNRAGLMAYLEKEIADSKENERYIFALLFLDLDGFKLVNDSFGHLLGDRLLIEVATRLRQCLRKTDILARFGGDEFIILLPDIAGLKDAEIVSKKIQQILKPTFNLDGQEAFIATSIGIVLSDRNNIHKPTNFLRNGDIALYKAKERGKGNYVVFDSTMLAEIEERICLETYLRQDINTNYFQVYYQPIIRVNSRQIIGFEALLRWQNPILGFIPPAKFIPIAEETGLIIDLGKRVLFQACQQITQWREKFPKSRAFFISINLSAKQFTQINLVEDIKNTLQKTNLPPKKLKLEITESIMMNDVDLNIFKIQHLQQLGIQFCIDDFGTGYSSLSYLHRFPIDILKIDRSFINCADGNGVDWEIVEAIIILAHKLGMEVVAEGVETELQLNRLKSYDCEQIQGYLFSPPLPHTSVEKLLTEL